MGNCKTEKLFHPTMTTTKKFPRKTKGREMERETYRLKKSERSYLNPLQCMDHMPILIQTKPNILRQNISK